MHTCLRCPLRPLRQSRYRLRHLHQGLRRVLVGSFQVLDKHGIPREAPLCPQAHLQPLRLGYLCQVPQVLCQLSLRFLPRLCSLPGIRARVRQLRKRRLDLRRVLEEMSL